MYDLNGLSAGLSYDFRVQTKCTDTTTGQFSEAYTFSTLTTNGGSYCTSYGQSTSYEFIQRVKIGAKVNASGNDNGYGNFTGIVAAVTADSQYTLKLTPGFTGASYAEYWTAYIDYNKDGDFIDKKELIGTTTSTSTSSTNLSFIIPLGALNGSTRLRIQMAYGTQITDPCAQFSYGEVEDYTVKVKGGTIAEAARVTNTNALMIIPNPIKGNSASAMLNLKKPGDVTMKITDLSGRVLVTQTLHLMAGKNTFALNGVGALMNGIFMIVAEQDGAVAGRVQLIVDR
jgi:hypothetical protein